MAKCTYVKICDSSIIVSSNVGCALQLAGVVFVHNHVSSIGGLTLLDLDLFWIV